MCIKKYDCNQQLFKCLFFGPIFFLKHIWMGVSKAIHLPMLWNAFPNTTGSYTLLQNQDTLISSTLLFTPERKEERENLESITPS